MESKKYFEDVAHDWDSMRKSFFPDSIREKAFSLVNFEEDAVIADIGCGTGFITQGLVDKPVNIIAVDQSQKMLDVMASKFDEYKNISYKLGIAESLPIPSESVDFVFANMYLHHIENPLDAIRETFRILKKGGALVITDLDKHNHSFLVTEQHDVWLGFYREDIEIWFAKAGFRNVKIDCVGECCKSDSQYSSDKADISVFVAFGEK